MRRPAHASRARVGLFHRRTDAGEPAAVGCLDPVTISFECERKQPVPASSTGAPCPLASERARRSAAILAITCSSNFVTLGGFRQTSSKSRRDRRGSTIARGRRAARSARAPACRRALPSRTANSSRRARPLALVSACAAERAEHLPFGRVGEKRCDRPRDDGPGGEDKPLRNPGRRVRERPASSW